MTDTELVNRLVNEVQRGPYFPKYPPFADLDFAIEVVLEQIEEWDYNEDPHGWCHQRPVLIALLRCAMNRTKP